MISLAKETQTPKLGRNTIYAFRLVLAAVWLFWGIRIGFAQQALANGPHGVSLASSLGVAPQLLSFIFGALFIAMGIWLIAGWAFRGCAVTQLLMILFLWWLHYEDGGFLRYGFEQLPMISLILTVFWYGPGVHVWVGRRRRQSTWTRG